jgi:hypothetical protein
MNERVDAFAALKELPAFEPTQKRVKPADAAIDRIAAEHGFPSRPSVRSPRDPKRKPRIHRTGRNISMNIKVRQQTQERFYRLADEHNLVLGALLDEAFDALEARIRAGTPKSG